MGEIKIETQRLIAEIERPKEVRFIDPTKLSMWTIKTAIEMVDGAVSANTIERAIESRDLPAYKAGKFLTVIPSEFIVWFKRHKK